MGAEAFLPAKADDLDALRRASRGCRGCDLYERATQTVFGEGSTRASLVLVGEQPGDSEDREGAPFVGPAGRILDGALAGAGIERTGVYVTNAVKHFKWESRGTRRLHKTPSARERAACRPWLMAELAAVRPEVLVCLGATASQSLFGSSFRLSQHRGEVLEGPGGVATMTTIHPSAVLRMEEPRRAAALAGLVEDLRRASSLTSSKRAS